MAHKKLTDLLGDDKFLKTRAEDKFFDADGYGVTKDEINNILEKMGRKEKLTLEEWDKYDAFTSERGANLIADELGTEEFIDKVIRLDENAARKIIGKIKDMKAAIKSLESKESREKYKRLRRAEKLFLQAAEQAGNNELVKFIQSDDEEEEDVDNEKKLQYNYNSKRKWTENILSTEDSSLFRECVKDTYINKKEPVFTDGMYLYEVNNKLIISDGNFEDPSIEAVVDIDVDNATNMQSVLEDIQNYVANIRERSTSIEFCKIIEARSDTSTLTVYYRNDYKYSESSKKSTYPTRRNGYQDFGYSGNQYYGRRNLKKIKGTHFNENGTLTITFEDNTSQVMTYEEHTDYINELKKNKKIQPSYAGDKSKTANHSLLAQAEKLESQGG